MTFTITHDTNDCLITAASKTRLIAALVDMGKHSKTELGKLSKPELINQAKEARNLECKLEEQRKASKEAKRLTELETDRKDSKLKAAVEALATGLEKFTRDANTALEKIHTEIVNEGPTGLADQLRWKAKDILFQDALMRRFDGTARFFRGQAKELTRTKTELLEMIEGLEEEALRDLVQRSDFESNSTCSMSNLEGQMNFKARQQYAKAMQYINLYFSKDLERDEDDVDGMACSYIWTF